MSRVVWKQPLEFRSNGTDHLVAEVELPGSAQLLSVQRQFDQICLWFSVVEGGQEPKRSFRFALVPTGGRIPENGVSPAHLATVQLDQGALIFHVFML